MSRQIHMGELRSEWDRLLQTKSRPIGFKSISEIASDLKLPYAVAKYRVESLRAAGKLDVVEGIFDGRHKRLFRPKTHTKSPDCSG